jgi:hypothetical protein
MPPEPPSTPPRSSSPPELTPAVSTASETVPEAWFAWLVLVIVTGTFLLFLLAVFVGALGGNDY